MLVIPDKLKDVDEIVLNKGMKFIDDLHVVDILHFSVAAFLKSEKHDKLHQQLLDLLVEGSNVGVNISVLLLELLKQVFFRDDLGENELDDVVVRIDEVVAAEFRGNAQDLSGDEGVLFL